MKYSPPTNYPLIGYDAPTLADVAAGKKRKMGVMWGELRGWVFLGGSGIILVVLRRRLCGFPLLRCHQGLVYELGTWWAPLLGSRLLYNPTNMHTRRLDRVKWQSVAFALARVQYRLVRGYLYP